MTVVGKVDSYFKFSASMVLFKIIYRVSYCTCWMGKSNATRQHSLTPPPPANESMPVTHLGIAFATTQFSNAFTVGSGEMIGLECGLYSYLNLWTRQI